MMCNSQFVKNMDEKIPQAILVPDVPHQFIFRNGLDGQLSSREIDHLVYLYDNKPEMRGIMEYPEPLEHVGVFLEIRCIPDYYIRIVLEDAFVCRDRGKILTNWYMFCRYGHTPYTGWKYTTGPFLVLCLLSLVAIVLLAICFRVICIVLFYILAVVMYMCGYIVCIADMKCNPANMQSFSQFIK